MEFAEALRGLGLARTEGLKEIFGLLLELLKTRPRRKQFRHETFGPKSRSRIDRCFPS